MTGAEAVAAIERVELVLKHWDKLGRGLGTHGTQIRNAIDGTEEGP